MFQNSNQIKNSNEIFFGRSESIENRDIIKANNQIQKNRDQLANLSVDKTEVVKLCHYCHEELNQRFFSFKNWTKENGNRFCYTCKQLHSLNFKIQQNIRKLEINPNYKGNRPPDKFEFKFCEQLAQSQEIKKTEYPVIYSEGQFRNVQAAYVTSGRLDELIKVNKNNKNKHNDRKNIESLLRHFSGLRINEQTIESSQKENKIVIKCFKDRQFSEGYRHTFVDYEMQETAIEIATSFQDYLNERLSEKDRIWIYQRKSYLQFFDKTIVDNDNIVIFQKNDPVMIESMIHKDYEKFNSNTGYSNDFFVLDALSHYSQHKQNVVLCDLQGHRGKHTKDKPEEKKGNYYQLLTDPCILTQDRKQGLSDLGEDGISNFFGQHKCNEICKDFKKPMKIEIKYKKQKSTSFEKPKTGQQMINKRDDLQLDKIIEEYEDDIDCEDYDQTLIWD